MAHQLSTAPLPDAFSILTTRMFEADGADRAHMTETTMDTFLAWPIFIWEPARPVQGSLRASGPQKKKEKVSKMSPAPSPGKSPKTLGDSGKPPESLWKVSGECFQTVPSRRPRETFSRLFSEFRAWRAPGTPVRGRLVPKSSLLILVDSATSGDFPEELLYPTRSKEIIRRLHPLGSQMKIREESFCPTPALRIDLLFMSV